LDKQRWANDRLWARADLLKTYASRSLHPAEAIALVRYREELTGRVIDLGCGGGRLTGYLGTLAQHTTGMDLSPVMLDYCRRRYPDAHFDLGDIRDLSAYADGSFDAVCAVGNLFDVLNDAERRRVLRDVGRMLRPGGLLLFSSHNLAAEAHRRRPTQLRFTDPARFALDALRLPRSMVNHLRLRPYERHEGDHAYLNDMSHDYMALHYYIGRDGQERQIDEAGFKLLEALDSEGHHVPAGETAESSQYLHYIARRSEAAG
jgi:SAM-dependent methyltransferase